MIQITPTLSIDEKNIDFDFIRGSGPGGQNVNKVATAVQLRYDLNAASLPQAVRRRLTHLAGNRITNDGILIIQASEHRRQEQNREAALERLVKLMRQAAKTPKKRRKTQPSRAAKQRRLEQKRRRSRRKRLRGAVRDYDE